MTLLTFYLLSTITAFILFHLTSKMLDGEVTKVSFIAGTLMAIIPIVNLIMIYASCSALLKESDRWNKKLF